MGARALTADLQTTGRPCGAGSKRNGRLRRPRIYNGRACIALGFGLREAGLPDAHADPGRGLVLRHDDRGGRTRAGERRGRAGAAPRTDRRHAGHSGLALSAPLSWRTAHQGRPLPNAPRSCDLLPHPRPGCPACLALVARYADGSIQAVRGALAHTGGVRTAAPCYRAARDRRGMRRPSVGGPASRGCRR